MNWEYWTILLSTAVTSAGGAYLSHHRRPLVGSPVAQAMAQSGGGGGATEPCEPFYDDIIYISVPGGESGGANCDPTLCDWYGPTLCSNIIPNSGFCVAYGSGYITACRVTWP